MFKPSKTSCFLPACGALLLTSVFVTLTPRLSYGQRKTTPEVSVHSNADSQAKDVNVVNAPGVVVTNPITLAADTSVSIHSPATHLLFQTPAGGVLVSSTQDLANLDVSSFKQIRILVVNHPSGGGSDAAVRVQLQIVEGGAAIGNLDTLVAPVDFSTTQENSSVTQVYDDPARNLRIKAGPLLNPFGQTGHATIDVLIYGR